MSMVSKKRKVCTIKSLSGQTFDIDKEDYDALRELLQFVKWSVAPIVSPDEIVSRFASISPKDRRVCECRVWRDYARRDYLEFHGIPPAIGRLDCLVILDLSGSPLETLPTAIGLLRNLKRLFLSDNEFLVELPTEIGDLSALEVLDLNETSIESLPDSMKNMKHLMYLGLDDTPVSGVWEKPGNVPVPLVSELIQQHQILGAIVTPYDLGPDILHALARNRSRFRLGLWCPDMVSIERVTSLWPLVLNAAPKAFEEYPKIEYAPGKYYGYLERYYKYKISKPAAIYQLLVDERACFVELLLHRPSKKAV